MDRLTVLRTFVLTAEHRSFAEAARRLGLSPGSVGRGIAGLEQSLGVALLRRTTRSVNITPEGAVYLDRCRRVLDDLDDADRTLRGENAEPRGPLILTAPVVFGRMHVLPVVNDLLSRHPALRVELTLSDRFVRLVEEGIDIALRIAELTDSALHAIRLAEVRRVLVASPSYVEAHGEPATIEQLSRHSLIGFGTISGQHELRFGGAGHPAIRYEPRLVTNSVESAIDAALAGIGMARLFSYQVQEHVRTGRLRYVLEAFEPAPTPVQLVYLGNRRRAPNVAAFIASAQAYCRGRVLA